MIRRMNEVRRENVALQHLSNVFWLETQSDAVMAYAKQEPGNTLICVVNLDPHHPQEGLVTVPAHLGLPPVFVVEDQFTGDHYDWRIGGNYVRLDPQGTQTHVLKAL
jgi:starch synthase (maltosyl-transferring)